MFHVPEMYRITGRHPLASSAHDGNNGAFELPPKIAGRTLWVIASDGTKAPEGYGGWEHVSVHAGNRANKMFMPCWEEMCHVKGIFWDPEDTVMQLHPPQSEYVNTHPYTLHLWRPVGQDIPLPPSLLVGIKGLTMRQRAG